MLQIEAKGFKEIQSGLKRVTNYQKTWRLGQLRGLADKLKDMVKEEIDHGGDGKGFRWKDKLYNSVRRQVVSDDEVAIMQSEEGLFVLYGTTGRTDLKGPPQGLLEWAESKLGLSKEEAWPVALSIAKAGILSQNRAHLGGKGYNYAEKIVTQTGKPVIEQYAKRMTDLAISYLKTNL